MKLKYHQWKGLQKLRRKHASITSIAGIPVEIWSSKVFEKLLTTNHSAFFKTFERQIFRGVPAVLTIFIFFYGLSDSGIHFSIQRISFFSNFLFLGQTLGTKENSSVLYNAAPLPETTSTLPKVSIHVPNMLRQLKVF